MAINQPARILSAIVLFLLLNSKRVRKTARATPPGYSILRRYEIPEGGHSLRMSLCFDQTHGKVRLCLPNDHGVVYARTGWLVCGSVIPMNDVHSRLDGIRKVFDCSSQRICNLYGDVINSVADNHNI